MPPLSKYLLIHFFIGIFLQAIVASDQLTFAYWFGAAMYLIAKEYVKGLHWTLCPKYKNYFNLVYVAAIIVIPLVILLFIQIPSSHDPPLFAAIFWLSFALIGHFVCFLAFCILYFLIRIPINIHKRRVEAQYRREEEFAAKRAYEERRRIDAERERQTREIAARQSSDLQRRIEARAECELFYDQHLKEVAKRFPREMFQSFMEKYLTDEQPVEAVERRAKELRRVIQFHRDAAKPPAKFQSVQEVTDWFLHEKQSLESLPINEEIREEQSVWLEQRYSELTQTMLEKIG